MTNHLDLEDIIAKAKSFVSPIELTKVIESVELYSSVQELDKLIPLFDALRKNDKIDTALIKMALGYSVKTYLEKETDDFENYLKCAMDIFQMASGGNEVNYWRFYKERNTDFAKEDRSVFALRANKVDTLFKRDLDNTTTSEFLKSIKQSGPIISLVSDDIGHKEELQNIHGLYLPVNIHLKSNSKPSFFGVIEILNKYKFSERDLEIANYFCRTQFSKEISRYFNERRDELTRLYTRKATKDLVLSEVKRSVKSKKPISVIMSDIDKFKSINDNRGHDAGDYVLSQYSKMLYKHTRPTDRVARYGGEEFLIILPSTDINEAHKIAERLRQKVEEEVIMINDDPTIITASFGVNQLDYAKIVRYIQSGIDDKGLYAVISKDLISPADKQMYRAKQTGRNKVCSELNLN